MIFKHRFNKSMKTPMEDRWLDNMVLFIVYNYNDEQVILDAKIEPLREMDGLHNDDHSVGGIIAYHYRFQYADFDNVEGFTDRESLRRRIARMKKATGEHPAFAALPILLESFVNKLPRRKEIGYSVG